GPGAQRAREGAADLPQAGRVGAHAVHHRAQPRRDPRAVQSRRVPRRGPQARRGHARGADARPGAFGAVLQMSVSLKVSGLAAGYGKKRVVDGIDLEVPAGGIVLLLGHNGAGKTTFARALFGLLRPEAGRVWLGEQEITGR